MALSSLARAGETSCEASSMPSSVWTMMPAARSRAVRLSSAGRMCQGASGVEQRRKMSS